MINYLPSDSLSHGHGWDYPGVQLAGLKLLDMIFVSYFVIFINILDNFKEV